MDDLKRMQDDLEHAVDKINDQSGTSSNNRQAPGQPPTETLQERLDKLIHSHKFMVAIIVLVVLDCTMVIAVLLFDLEIVELGEEHKFVPKIFHYTSLGILCLFLIEISIRLYVLRLTFFKHKLEVFDAIIVIISFILDIVFRDSEDATTGAGLLILLRLWRVTRIVNGIILSVQKQAEEKLENEKHLREICQQNMGKYRQYCLALEEEIANLKQILTTHDIKYPDEKHPKLDLIDMPEASN